MHSELNLDFKLTTIAKLFRKICPFCENAAGSLKRLAPGLWSLTFLNTIWLTSGFLVAPRQKEIHKKTSSCERETQIDVTRLPRRRAAVVVNIFHCSTNTLSRPIARLHTHALELQFRAKTVHFSALEKSIFGIAHEVKVKISTGKDEWSSQTETKSEKRVETRGVYFNFTQVRKEMYF